jgi:RNA polymerase sigma-70 factor (ECF subfamily)
MDCPEADCPGARKIVDTGATLLPPQGTERLAAAEETREDASGEAEWLRQIARGDRAAFEKLYASYAPRVFRFLQRMLRDTALAEEATNDVLVEVWKSAGRFEGRSAPSTWILGIARFRALNLLRGRRPPTEQLEPASEVALPERVGSGQDLTTRNRWLRTGMGQLSPEHREVLELTFFHGCSYREIAEIAQCPENTVKTRMFHAKRRLRPLLEQLGLAEGLA